MKRIVAKIVIASVVITSCHEPKKMAEENLEKKQFTPPFSHLNPAFTAYKVDAEKKQIIKRENGTSIYIPKNAFVHSSGKPVKGKVDIAFREFHDAIDVFLSGIRMDMTVNGEKRHFETTGMFEINGSQNNMPVYIAEGKKITVNLPANNLDTNFKTFKVNDNLEWEYARDTGQIIFTGNKKELTRIKNRSKTTPFPLPKNYFVLNYYSIVDVLFGSTQGSTNELVQAKMDEYGFTKKNIFNRKSVKFGGRGYPADLVLWELIGKQIPLKFQTNGVGSSFKQVKGNKYKITLRKNDGSLFTTYANAIIPLTHLFKMPASEWKTKYDAYKTALKEEEKRYMMEQGVIRSLEVEDFGIYNWDRFVKSENHVKIMASYNFITDSLFGNSVYCLLKNDKALVKLQYKDKLILTPDEPAILFSVLPGNTLWVHPLSKFKTLDFKKMRLETNPKHTFKFNKVKELKSEEQFRELIKA